MNNTSYINLSGQLALQRRLETVANNVANSTTPGYRAEEVRFESLLSGDGQDPVAFVSRGDTYLSRASGGLNRTGNPLDVAVEGDAWLGIQAAGGVAYTRDGRLSLSPAGELQSTSGSAILDPGGTPILIDPSKGALTIARDGRIMQGDKQVAALGLFTIPETARLARGPDSSVIPDVAAAPVADFARAGVVQGFVENSNVNPIKEMTHLIAVQRAFDAVSTTISSVDAAVDAGIRDLGTLK